MASNVKLAAYWGARTEPVEVCAEKINRLLVGLKGISSQLALWRTAGKQKIVLDAGDIEKIRLLLLKGRNYTDIDRKVIPELGYSFSVCNGNRGATAQISSICGAASKMQRLCNNCLIDINLAIAKTLDVEGLIEILENLIKVFNPDEAMIFIFEPKSDDVEQVILFKYFADKTDVPAGVVKIKSLGSGAIGKCHATMNAILGLG